MDEDKEDMRLACVSLEEHNNHLEGQNQEIMKEKDTMENEKEIMKEAQLEAQRVGQGIIKMLDDERDAKTS